MPFGHDRRPAVNDFSRLNGKLTKLPVYEAEGQDPFKNGLRSANPPSHDLRESGKSSMNIRQLHGVVVR